MELVFKIHEDIPRQGPGDNESTRKAYSKLSNISGNPRILDIGCGSGMQTIELAKFTNGRITAFDVYIPFLKDLLNNAEKEKCSDKINVVCGSMLSMDFLKTTYDIIWSEGSIFIMGFEKGLNYLQKYLKDRGWLVVSELCWLDKNAPEELHKYWDDIYPDIKDINQYKQIIKNTGYLLIDHFTLPDSSWWDNYYNPLSKRLKKLEKTYKNNKRALAELEANKLEIEIFRKYSHYYGYEFFIMQKK